MTKAELKKKAADIRKSVQTYAERSSLYPRFRVKCVKKVITMQGALQLGMEELGYLDREGISKFHRFKVYCKKKDIPMMEALEHIMEWYIKN